jgi:NADH-ubiquinone oxidoreductase chain 4
VGKGTGAYYNFFNIMNIISPLTLLIIPLIGSIIILLNSENKSPYLNSLITDPFSTSTSSLPPFKPVNGGIKEKAIEGENNGKVYDVLMNGKYNLSLFQSSKYKRIYLKQIALITSLINLIISIIMWIQFDSNYIGYQFLTIDLATVDTNSFLQFNLGVDGISIYFVLLTTFITPIALLSSHNDIEKNLKFYLISILLLETLQIAVFVSLDLLLFYVFFESVLIPLFLIIGVWGASEARVRAAYLLFLYTLFGSLFMLLAIAKIYSELGSTDFSLLSISEINLESQKWLWLGFFIAFAIKTPLWPWTGWLFRAHVEAPLSGSVILAAVILKLATYAYLRILISFLPDATHFFSPLVQGICIITLIYASLSALRTHDSKALVALSSISHCALIVLGLFSNTVIGIEGGILLGLAHGFVSPALFICVGGVLYVRFHTRVIPYLRGITTYMPIFSILFLFFTLANASIPLTAGWVGEQMSLIGVFERSPIAGALGATSIFLTACYSMFLYNRVAFGQYSSYIKPIKDLDRREFIVLFSLLIPTVIFGIWPNVILESLHLSVSNLIYQVPIPSV